MKRLFAALLTAALAIGATAHQASAQTYGTIALTAVTNSILPSAAETTTAVIDLRGNRNVAVDARFQGDGSGTANATFAFVPSLNGTTFETTKVYALVAPANGTTAVHVMTNWDFGAYGYLKLAFVTNAHATVTLTNVAVTVALKPGS